MKRIPILLATLAVILAGCSKDESATEPSQEPTSFKAGQKVTLTASVNDNATRATSEYNAGTSAIDFKWSAGDVLTVTAGGKSTTFTLKEGAGTAEATFEGTMPADGNTFDASFGSSTVPTSQTYSSTVPIPSNAMYFTATNCTLNGSLTLEPKMTVLKLDLYGDKTIGRIEFNDGSTTYTLNTGGVTLTETKQPFYMVVPSGTYTFTAKVYDTTGTNVLRTLSPSSAQTFTAGKFLNMPARYISDCFYFEAETAGSSVSFAYPSLLQYLLEGDDTWNQLTYDAPPLANKGDRVFLKAVSSNNNLSNSSFTTGLSDKLKAGGNIMYLLNCTAPATTMTTDNKECFKKLFYNMTITDISELKLPATTLAESCYEQMFKQCRFLATIPSGLLPATTLAKNCYKEMFMNCQSLATIPSDLLPATTLVEACYHTMFNNCPSLTTVPVINAETLAENCCLSMFEQCTSLVSIPSGTLPATKLAKSCYLYMFSECSSLATIPSDLLPATTLDESCYEGMFLACSSLVAAPKLEATTLKEACYSRMFIGCSSLTTAPELSAGTLAAGCYANMFGNCSNLSSVTMLATDINATNCLFEWLSEAGADASSRTVYVANSMVEAVKAKVPDDWQAGVQVKP